MAEVSETRASFFSAEAVSARARGRLTLDDRPRGGGGEAAGDHALDPGFAGTAEAMAALRLAAVLIPFVAHRG